MIVKRRMKVHTFIIICTCFFLLSCDRIVNFRTFNVKFFYELDSSELGDEIAYYTLSLYRNAPEEATFCAGWDQPIEWYPSGGEFFDSREGMNLKTEEERTFEFDNLEPGRWGFVLIAKAEGMEKDLARGCISVTLAEGINPRQKLRIKRIQWPGECGDGKIDQNEMCDDGNTVDDISCSSDCSQTPVFQINTLYDNSQMNPSISGANSIYIVAWTSGGSSAAGELSQHVRARAVDSYGQGLPVGISSNDMKLNVTSTNQNQYLPSVGIGSSAFMTIWLDNNPSVVGNPPGDIMWRLIDIDSGTGRGEVQIFEESEERVQNWAKLAGWGGAKFFAGWISSDVQPKHAMCSIYDMSVGSWSTVKNCGGENPPSDDEAQVNVAMAPTGEVAVWVSGGGIYVQFFDTAGRRQGDYIRADTTEGRCDYPAVAFDSSGRFLVVWRYQPGIGDIQIRGRIFDAGAEPVQESDFQINTTALTGGPNTGGSNPNYLPAVAGDPDPSVAMFFVVWDAPGAGGARGRIVLSQERFGINRVIRSSPGEHFTSTGDFPLTIQQYYKMDEVTVACASAGMCMVVWSDESTEIDTDGKGIRGRVIPIVQP